MNAWPVQGDNVLIDLRRDRKVIKYIDLGMATYRKGLNFHLPEDQMTKFNFLSPEVGFGDFLFLLSLPSNRAIERFSIHAV